MPIDRGDRYEDPLEETLDGLGEVVGGGSLMTEDGEISEVDIEMNLSSEDAADVVCRVLTELGAPRGSTLTMEGVTRTFGEQEGVAIYLDGVSLPAEVYASSDINAIVDQLDAAARAASAGEWRHHWRGPRETALYFYGPNASMLFDALEPVMGQIPLCQNARVVLRPGRNSTREIRLPRSSEA
jgi:hypothetical protein